MDIAPFQRHRGVQAKQIHRTEPPVDETLFSGTNSETLPSTAQDFSDVPLAYKESAFEYFGVTLAREENRLGELPDPDRILEFHFIVLTIENISIETCYC